MNFTLTEKTALDVKSRIMNVLPASTYHMDRFLRLVDVTLSDECATACIESGPPPRMVLGKKFVATNCRTDEHLFMLVLHELYHVILGHNLHFKDFGIAENIAFDAVINSTLCHSFRDPVYVGFFEKTNSWKDFPGRLLRPPVGWLADKPWTLPEDVSTPEKRVLDLLYRNPPDTVTYSDILKLLESNGIESLSRGDYVLLGDHDKRNNGQDADVVRNPLVKEILVDVTAGWDQSDKFQGLTDAIKRFRAPKPKQPRMEFLKALRKLMSKAGILDARSYKHLERKKVACKIEQNTVIPDPRDRTAPARKALFGRTPVLYRSQVKSSQPRWEPANKSHVYVDISGSMFEDLPWLLSAMDVLERKELCSIFVFSTAVDCPKRGRLLKDALQNTGGTDINCVFEHLLSFPKTKTPRRIVVLTDGYTGVPDKDLVNKFRDRRCELFVGLLGPEQFKICLEPYSKLIMAMPTLQ